MNETVKCCKCDEPAVARWPAVDPDIRSNPYCRECLEKAKMKLMIALYELKENKKKEEE